ncbi:MAG: SIMPL domain-containing protein [Patescibacteria group bacterium]
MAPLPSSKDKSLNGIIVAVGTVLVLYLAILSIKALAEYRHVGLEPRGRETFTIEGEGNVSAQPTLAEVDLGLYSEGRDVTPVQQTNAAKINAIISALKQMGIADADMQTSNYNISPKFEYAVGIQNVIGYTVSQNLKVKVRNLSNVGAVLSKAGELGANQVNGVRFTIDDPTDARQEARTKAISDAKSKAKELADAMGVRIVKIVTFSESTDGTVPPPVFYRGLDSAAVPEATPDIRSGALDVQSRVSVTFEIR